LQNILKAIEEAKEKPMPTLPDGAENLAYTILNM
jgi:hypothetical protein